MTLADPVTSAREVADTIRRQLGTAAVVLVTVGQQTCAVVIAPETGDPAPLASAQPVPGPEMDKQGGRLAYSIAEAATVLGLSRDVLYDQIRAGHLGSLKVGRRRIITRAQIDSFLAGLT